jgi:hypothetical protein
VSAGISGEHWHGEEPAASNQRVTDPRGMVPVTMP